MRTRAARLRLRDVDRRVLLDALNKFLDDHLVDWGAALTFYAAISLIPALVVLIGVVGLLGDPVLDDIRHNLSEQAQTPLRDMVLDVVAGVERRSTAGIALLVGLAGAVWTASAYVGGFLRASAVVHGRGVRYPFLRLRRLQLVVTFATVLAISGTAIVVIVTGPLAEGLASLVGLDRAVTVIWEIAKWPLVVVFTLGIFGVLYWASFDDRRDRGFQLITPGGVIAMAAWLLGSAAYGVYVDRIANYSNIYGSLAAVIGFLIWLWGSNMAMLFGVELNDCLERRSSGHVGGDARP